MKFNWFFWKGDDYIFCLINVYIIVTNLGVSILVRILTIAFITNNKLSMKQTIYMCQGSPTLFIFNHRSSTPKFSNFIWKWISTGNTYFTYSSQAETRCSYCCLCSSNSRCRDSRSFFRCFIWSKLSWSDFCSRLI